MKPTHYETLGLEQTATQEDIKLAYKRLASKYHPDRNPDNSSYDELFKKITHAYQVLNNPETKTLYDKTIQDPIRPHQVIAIMNLHQVMEQYGYAPDINYLKAAIVRMDNFCNDLETGLRAVKVAIHTLKTFKIQVESPAGDIYLQAGLDEDLVNCETDKGIMEYDLNLYEQAIEYLSNFKYKQLPRLIHVTEVPWQT